MILRLADLQRGRGRGLKSEVRSPKNNSLQGANQYENMRETKPATTHMFGKRGRRYAIEDNRKRGNSNVDILIVPLACKHTPPASIRRGETKIRTCLHIEKVLHVAELGLAPC